MSVDVARHGSDAREPGKLSGLSPLTLLRGVLLLVAVVWLTYTLARLFWLGWAIWQSPPPALPPPPPSVAVNAAPAVDIDLLVNAHLFGQADAPASATVQEAPDSSVALKLVSVYVASVPERSNAIVEEMSGNGSVIGIGEDLPGGNGKLKEVFPDRIIIDRGGRLETLRIQILTDANLQLDGAPATADAAGDGATLDKRKDTRLSQELRQMQQQLQTDPMSLAEVIRMEPDFRDGVLTGYRLAPGKDTKLFARFGLQRNDVLKAVNGVPLSDPGQAMSLLSSLQSAREFSVTVERGGRPVNVLLSLENP